MTAFQKLDTALGKYYQQFGDYNYFDNNGIGKFLWYCLNESFDQNDIEDELADGNEEDCGYLDFDPNFPLRPSVATLAEAQKRSEIFRILQYCYKYNDAPDATAIDIDTELLIDSPLSPNSSKPRFKFANAKRARRFVLDFTRSTSPKRLDEERVPASSSTLDNNIPETKSDSEAPEEENLNDLQKLCRGIAGYYLSMKRNDYYDAYGMGKFTKWFEEEAMDMDEMKEELIDGTMEDCSYLDFDKDIHTKINRFPLPSSIVNENEKLQKQFEIIAEIYRNGRVPNRHRQFSVNFDIKTEHRHQTIESYKAQCPRLVGCFESEPDLMYLLSIGYFNNIPFALWLLDCFMRDRLRTYLTNNGKQLTVSEWTQTIDSNGISEYVNNLKTKYTMNGKHDIVTCIQTGIKAYISRILPQFKFDMLCTIRDDLFEIAHYIEAASQFVMKIIAENDDTHAPFQWDFCIAVRDVTDKKGNILIPHGADPKELLHSEQSIDVEDMDIIGDIKKKLKSNDCWYYHQEVNTKASDTDRNDLLIRSFWKSYDKFREKYGLKPLRRNQSNLNDRNTHNMYMFPWMRRFSTLIDRRKYVTITDEKHCESNSDAECPFHEEQDRNCRGQKKDDIFFWIPPTNCDKIPYDKNGYVSEVFMDNLNTCILPRIGYNKSMDHVDHFKIEDSFGVNKPTKCRLLTSTITSKNNCNERLLIFSFHIESIEEIRCYLWWKGCCLRFMPQDIIDVLPLLFDKTYKNNDKFTQSDNIKDLVKQIEFTDKCFNKWHQKITNKHKQ